MSQYSLIFPNVFTCSFMVTLISVFSSSAHTFFELVLLKVLSSMLFLCHFTSHGRQNSPLLGDGHILIARIYFTLRSNRGCVDMIKLRTLTREDYPGLTR